MCFSTILSRVLLKYFVYIPPTPLSNGPSVNKVLLIIVGITSLSSYVISIIVSSLLLRFG